MFKVLGEEYYLDIEKMVSLCQYEERDEDDSEEQVGISINVFKFDIYKACLERVISEYEDADGDVAAFTSTTTNTGFGISFNTLLKDKIIKT